MPRWKRIGAAIGVGGFAITGAILPSVLLLTSGSASAIAGGGDGAEGLLFMGAIGGAFALMPSMLLGAWVMGYVLAWLDRRIANKDSEVAAG